MGQQQQQQQAEAAPLPPTVGRRRHSPPCTRACRLARLPSMSRRCGESSQPAAVSLCAAQHCLRVQGHP
jgi:hypothetical protein